jgi:hypothetical protein
MFRTTGKWIYAEGFVSKLVESEIAGMEGLYFCFYSIYTYK